MWQHTKGETALKPIEMVVLVILAAIWGSSFLFLRIASPVFGPFMTVFLRVFVAGVALFLYSRISGKATNMAVRWKKLLILGGINSALPFTLISTATLTLNASMASILNSTVPIFTAFVTWLWLKEPFTRQKAAGILLGITGVVILLGWNPQPLTTQVLLAAGCSFSAACCFALGGVYAKLNFQGVDSLTMASGQLLGASVWLMPFALFHIPSGPVPITAAGAVMGLALICAALAYLMYFYLIARTGPTKTLSVTYLIPFFGVLWGTLFLGETITGSTLLGLVVILAGITLINGFIPLGRKYTRIP